VILLDEIEKAHPAVFDVLLQALGEGRLTDERGRTAHLGNALFLMTSNLGASRKAILHPHRAGDERLMEGRVLEAVRRHFRPEFVNRLSSVFVFKPPGPTEIAAIAWREIERLSQRHGLASRGVAISLTNGAFDAVMKVGYTPALGARPMERAIDRLLGAPLARYLAERPLEKRCRLTIDFDEATGLTKIATRAALEADQVTEAHHG